MSLTNQSGLRIRRRRLNDRDQAQFDRDYKGTGSLPAEYWESWRRHGAGVGRNETAEERAESELILARRGQDQNRISRAEEDLNQLRNGLLSGGLVQPGFDNAPKPEPEPVRLAQKGPGGIPTGGATAQKPKTPTPSKQQQDQKQRENRLNPASEASQRAADADEIRQQLEDANQAQPEAEKDYPEYDFDMPEPRQSDPVKPYLDPSKFPDDNDVYWEEDLNKMAEKMGIDAKHFRSTPKHRDLVRSAIKQAFAFRTFKGSSDPRKQRQEFDETRAKLRKAGYLRLEGLLGAYAADKQSGIGLKTEDRSDREVAENTKLDEAVAEFLDNIQSPPLGQLQTLIGVIKNILSSGLEYEAEQGRDQLEKRQKMRDELDTLRNELDTLKNTSP